MCIVSAVDNAEVFRFDQIPRNPQIGIEVLLRGIVNIAPQYGDTVREIGPSPNGHVNQFAVCAQNTLFDFRVDLGRAVVFAVSDIRIKGRADAGGGKRVESHRANEVVNMTTNIDA